MTTNLFGIKSQTIFKRSPVVRKMVRGFNKETAARSIGDISHGMECFGFTKGQFSKIDIIEHCLETTGPADVSIITWSASTGDIQRAHAFLENKLVKSIRFLVDFSFKARKPLFLAELVETFGQDAVRLTVVHAKSVLIRNADWNIVVRTSMNLNYNPRFENFEISESKLFADFIQKIFDEIWSDSTLGEILSTDVGPVQQRFRRLYDLDGFSAQNVLDLIPATL